MSENCSVVSSFLRPHGLYIYSPWNSPGQITGVGSFSLLQGIFPTQGSNPGLPHCKQILYQLSHKGSLQPKAKTYFLHSFFCYSFFHVPNILCYYFFKVVSIIKGYPVFIPVNNFYYIALR